MNTSQQKAFLMAAECLNFTAAADKLYISQPVLSRNIAALEAELGILLFIRKNNTLHLTPGGEIMYQWMKSSQISLNDALHQARLANMEPQGELRIGFVTSENTPEQEAQNILEFQKQSPETRLTILHCSARELIVGLSDHSIDIAVMIDSELTHDSRFETAEIHCSNQKILVSRAHPLADFEPISIRAFSSEVFISIKQDYSPVLTDYIKRVCSKAGFVPRIREEETPAAQLAQVEAQQGVALVPGHHFSLSNPLVRQLELKEALPMQCICVWDRGNTNEALHKYLEIRSRCTGQEAEILI